MNDWKKNWTKILNSNLKDSFKSIEDLTDKILYKAYKDWQKWLLTFRDLSKNTALSYGYDFKYFLNFYKITSGRKIKLVFQY